MSAITCGSKLSLVWCDIGTVGVGKRTCLVTDAVVTGAVGAGARAVVCSVNTMLGLIDIFRY